MTQHYVRPIKSALDEVRNVRPMLSGKATKSRQISCGKDMMIFLSVVVTVKCMR